MDRRNDNTRARSFASLNWRYGLGFFFLTLFTTTSLQAQSLSPQTVYVAGGYTKAAGFHVLVLCTSFKLLLFARLPQVGY
jgi:hypothetical protein